VIAAMTAGQEKLLGESVTYAVTASGSTPLSFQWRKDGVAIAEATRSTLTLVSIGAADAGTYSVVVTNSVGAITSANAALSVKLPGRIVNLSILTSLSSPGDAFTLGVVLGGAGTRGSIPLLLRAAGPSLFQFGVLDGLGDPKLEVFSGALKNGENDDWGGSNALLTAISQAGAFSFLAPSSKDAALLARGLAADTSIKISGSAGSTGTVIAELYDASDRATMTSDTPRVINVSVLKPIGAGLTAGLVINGSTEVTVLVRAIGPSLTAFGVMGPVADPKIEILRADRTVLTANDDWGGGAELAETFSKAGAFALAGTSKDAAVIAKLAPGNYTVQVSAANAATGSALVEIYEVP
jgi:hypothetical protein